MTNEYGFEIPLVSEEECKLQERIEELEAQIEELKIKLSTYEGAIGCSDCIELEKKNKELEAQIEKMKWHKVADGDLPKDRHNVYVVYLNGDYQLEKTIASFRHKYWVFNGLKTECEIIAWCELPKWEIKEK